MWQITDDDDELERQALDEAETARLEAQERARQATEILAAQKLARGEAA